MNRLNAPTLLTALAACACSSTTFVSTWKAPDVQTLEIDGATIAAVAIMRSEASRREAEDALARSISEHGAQGVALYKIAPEASASNEDSTRAKLEQAGVKGVVVLKPIAVEKEVTPDDEGIYPGYWGGGYYVHGWSDPWGDVPAHTTTTVVIELRAYSLEKNKLVWAGQSKTVEPEKLSQLVTDVADAAAKELEREHLIAR